MFPGNLCFITSTLSIEFAAETNDGYHIILKWKQRMRGSEQAPYVFLKIQPSAHSLHTSWTLLKIALLGIVMETITGKGKKGSWPILKPLMLLSMECVLPFSTSSHLHKMKFHKKTNHRISILLSFFASIYFVALLKGRKNRFCLM